MDTAKQRITKAIVIADQYSQIDGDHHKAWTIDQMVRALLGTKEKYEAFVAAHKDGDTYDWDEGIAP